jgi:hypothetical protein
VCLEVELAEMIEEGAAAHVHEEGSLVNSWEAQPDMAKNI